MKKLNSKYPVFFFLLVISIYAAGCSSSNKTVNVIFTVKSLQPLPGQTIYITGNVDELGSWAPGAVPLKRMSDSVWSTEIKLPQKQDIEFKITKGSWATEAADQDGWLFKNFTFVTNTDTLVEITVPQWKDKLYARTISSAIFNNPDPRIYLINNWKYHPGDDPNWAKENCNDTSWETVTADLTPQNFPKSGWENIGWFRTHIKIDSSVWKKSFAFTISHFGASEVYINGRLYLKTGTIGMSEKEYKPKRVTDWESFSFDKMQDQVIAVRYANYSVDYQNSINLQPGFTIYIAPAKYVLHQVVKDTRNSAIEAMVFTLIPLVLALFHLIMFGFYRKQKQNLYYALCLLGFAGLTYFKYERLVLNNPDIIIFFIIMNVVASVSTIFFGLLTAFSISCKKLPFYWYYFLLGGIIIISVGIFQPASNLIGILIYSYFGLAMVSIILTSYRSKDTNFKGLPLIFAGFLVLAIFIIYQILIDYSFVTPLFSISGVVVYGMLALAVSMSFFLAYNFAYVNKDLELQLTNVKIYSEKALEQERIANQAELERRVIQVENDRKTEELEEARKLQLSLLPKKIPYSANYDIACFMQTATEVGGDYYDFFESDNDELTIAIGDATGHGLKAGNMVMTAKALLNQLSKERDLKCVLTSLNEDIKKMNLHMLTMCLSLLRINGKEIKYSSAGMPPLLIYKAGYGKIEKIIHKTMPLGAFRDFPYTRSETVLQSGDVILLMSDGLEELFNEKKEMYGMENIEESLIANSALSADEIVKNLYNESQRWSSNNHLTDDITLVAVKIL